MMADLKFALRTLAKRPSFSAVAIITLALGIGANTAIFSVVEGTLLRPLPFQRSEQLVRLYEAENESGVRSGTLNLSEQTLRRWREFGRDIFQGIGAATGANVIVGSTNGEPARNEPAARISADFFSVLGLLPMRGRNFTLAEDTPGGPAAVMISDNFWQENLGGRDDVIGSIISIDRAPHTVIGIMPKSFRHPYRANIWLPLALSATGNPAAANHYLYAPARLRGGLTIPQAEAAVRRMCAAVNQSEPNPNNPHGAYMPPLRESFVLDVRPKILVIVAAACCALLIAAANFTGLLLARVIESEGEFALRAALGATPTRLIRQQLVQALVFAGIGTLLGLLIASWATPVLFAMSPEGSDATASAMREFDYTARIDWPVFGFAAAVMSFIGLGFGFFPALRASRTDLRNAISATARGATLDRGARRLLGSLVVVELSFAVALLMASITSIQYFRKLIEEPWGFATEKRLTFHTTLSDRLFPEATSKQQAIDAALAQLRALPGVADANVTMPSPMNAPRNLISFNAEGASATDPRGYQLSYLRIAAPGYFKAIGQPLLRGRDFRESDDAESPQVCVVSDVFARRCWPDQNPVGKRVKWGRLDGPRPWLSVVGVVGDMKVIADPNDGEVIGMIARPLAQMLPLGADQVEELTFVVHSKGALPTEPSLRAALTRADTRLALYQMVSLDDAARQSRITERFIFVLVSLFGTLGLLLSAIGLYGLLSLQVARRWREIGIRSALGATARQIVQLIATEGARLFNLGLVAGGFATWSLMRLIQHYWPQMPAPNITAWIGGGFIICATVALACWLPARRAVHVDPVVALRAE